ncbi:hypothetical protein TNCV_3519531 [Trichonephila clavipes]|uniref:Uncharacterized protein n=1 Tax=Trichonephila clavipes TaxID=2585209 RepID=A0A8X6T365_TRICX|nr:hypothetical protein TNCV_3519531 [Trichonephila clavipes]
MPPDRLRSPTTDIIETRIGDSWGVVKDLPPLFSFHQPIKRPCSLTNMKIIPARNNITGVMSGLGSQTSFEAPGQTRRTWGLEESKKVFSTVYRAVYI